MKKGIICFSVEGRKVIEIKITNTFPIISLGTNAILLDKDGNEIDISGFQHLSIPSDLKIHLTKQKKGSFRENLYFQVPELVSRPCVDERPQLFFSYISLPVAANKLLKGTWEQAAIIVTRPNGSFDPNRTRMFVEFFGHSNPDIKSLDFIPYAIEEMRPTFEGFKTFGPFGFDELQRRKNRKTNLFFSMRFGYIEIAKNDYCYVFVPYEIKKIAPE